ncbi:hypothetical protein NL676_021845 [Syzygium grande]|nr:hypothetical protein NL676_021845 [Syzygium grande]
MSPKNILVLFLLLAVLTTATLAGHGPPHKPPAHKPQYTEESPTLDETLTTLDGDKPPKKKPPPIKPPPIKPPPKKPPVGIGGGHHPPGGGGGKAPRSN